MAGDWGAEEQPGVTPSVRGGRKVGPGGRGVLTGEWDEAMENPVPG